MTSSHSRFADGRLRGGGDEIITDPSPAVFPAHRGVRKCDRTLSSAQPIPETLRGACRGKVATSSDDTFPGESIASPSQPREHLGPSVPSLHSPCRQVYSAKPRADPPGTRFPRNERRGERQRRFGQTSRSKSSASGTSQTDYSSLRTETMGPYVVIEGTPHETDIHVRLQRVDVMFSIV